jgi:uncharacterized protein (DUF1778 family)
VIAMPFLVFALLGSQQAGRGLETSFALDFQCNFMTVLTLSGRQSNVESEGVGMPSSTLRSEKLDLRLTRKAKTALRAAAAASNRSVSEFVLESALARADEALADRRTFGLNAAQWKAFLAALDAPPRPLPRLERLLKEPGFFDAGSPK